MGNNRIKKLRESRNIGQKELAIDLKVTQPTVSNWELGYKEPSSKSAAKIADYFGVSIDYLLCRENTENQKGIMIPVLGLIQAGIPVEAVEDIIDYEEIPFEMAEEGDFFALKVRGDSMEPKISEGDVVVVRKQTSVESGDIAVVLVNGHDATIKRIKKDPKGIMLVPNNHAYDPRFYSNKDIEDLPVTIIGKVVELRAKF